MIIWFYELSCVLKVTRSKKYNWLLESCDGPRKRAFFEIFVMNRIIRYVSIFFFVICLICYKKMLTYLIVLFITKITWIIWKILRFDDMSNLFLCSIFHFSMVASWQWYILKFSIGSNFQNRRRVNVSGKSSSNGSRQGRDKTATEPMLN